MKISVIIPTYKPQNYLWQCLESLNSQTLPKKDFEIILILNGEIEPYKNKIETFIESRMPENNIKLFCTTIGGVSNARNIGISQSQGQYIAFIDDDDYVSSGYLEELYAKATPDTVSVCYPYAFKDGEKDKQLKYNLTEAYNCCVEKFGKLRLTSQVRKLFSGPCMKLIPKNIIQERRFDVRFRNGEDSLFMFLISDKIDNIVLTSKEAIYYRRYRENSAVVAKRSFISVVRNSLLSIGCYTKIYISSPLKYSFSFYFTRLLGAIRLMIIHYRIE